MLADFGEHHSYFIKHPLKCVLEVNNLFWSLSIVLERFSILTTRYNQTVLTQLNHFRISVN
jgi:hypothetical protein